MSCKNMCHLKKSRAAQSGVTLIELMIVLVIIGIAMMAVSPSMSTLIANKHADKIADELKLDIAFARNQATTISTQIDIYPNSSGWDTGWEIRQDTSIIRLRGSTTDPMADSGTITSSDFSASTPISFDRKGRAINTGSLTIDVSGCVGDRKYIITINQIGQIIVTESACS